MLELGCENATVGKNGLKGWTMRGGGHSRYVWCVFCGEFYVICWIKGPLAHDSISLMSFIQFIFMGFILYFFDTNYEWCLHGCYFTTFVVEGKYQGGGDGSSRRSFRGMGVGGVSNHPLVAIGFFAMNTKR